MLASLLAVLAGVLALAAWSPAGFAVALAAGVALTLAGGAVVAGEARRRALGVADAPGTRPPDARIEAAAGVFLAAFVALVAGAAPGAYFKDGGELAAAAHSLGVAHPTGFPLFCLAGKGFSLVPAGGVFFRMNALSAAATALAAALAYLLARLLSPRSRWSGAAALLAPAGLLGGHAVWLHGTTTEVYAISLAGLAASLLAFALAARRRDASALVLGWLLTGLGAGGHVTWPIYASMTGIVVTALTLGAWKGRRASILGASALLAVATALIVLYLPAAAARDPVVNWGDPSSATALLDHLTGRRIRESFAGEIGQFRLGLFRAHLVEVFRVAWQGTGPLWPLAAAGMLAAVFRERAFAACAAGIVAADWLYSARVNPMGVHDLQTLQPATLCVSVLAATAIARLMSMGKGNASLAGGLAAAAALAVGMQWGGSPGERGLAHVHAPREVTAGMLGTVEPGATVFTTSDDLSAGIAAAQAVEGARPDVLSVVKQHLSDGAYVARKVRAHRAYPADERILAATVLAPFEVGETPAEALGRAAGLAAARGPLYVEPGEGGVDRAMVAAMRPGFPAFSARKGDDAALEAVAEAFDAGMRVLAHVPSADRWGREYLAGYLRLLATDLALKGHEPQAAAMLERALSVSPRDPRTLNNLAALLNQAGRGPDALVLLREAVAEAPSYLRGWRTLANVTRGMGMQEEAAEAERRLQELME